MPREGPLTIAQLTEESTIHVQNCSCSFTEFLTSLDLQYLLTHRGGDSALII